MTLSGNSGRARTLEGCDGVWLDVLGVDEEDEVTELVVMTDVGLDPCQNAERCSLRMT